MYHIEMLANISTTNTSCTFRCPKVPFNKLAALSKSIPLKESSIPHEGMICAGNDSDIAIIDLQFAMPFGFESQRN